MLIVCISDTHELHREVNVPAGDLLIHAGDFLFQQNHRPKAALREFNEWLGSLPHRFKVAVPGNHDWLLENERNRNLITNATLLIDDGVEVEGVRIWGSPVTPLYGGAFGKSSAADRRRHWAKIPSDTDVLVTHGPAFGILDQEADIDVHQGDAELLEAITRVHPALHVFGHIHGGYGTLQTVQTLHVNAALYDELGGIERQPIVIPDFRSPIRERSR